MKKLLAGIFVLSVFPAFAQISETTEGCLYSKHEIEAAFEAKVIKINGAKITNARWGEGKFLSCDYVGSIHFTLAQEISGRNTDLPKKLPHPSIGGIEQIPSDPDGAYWRIAGPSILHLIYFRGNTQTKIIIADIDTRNPSQLANVKTQALKLRRIP